jgi:hypothetical protein
MKASDRMKAKPRVYEENGVHIVEEQFVDGCTDLIFQVRSGKSSLPIDNYRNSKDFLKQITEVRKAKRLKGFKRSTQLKVVQGLSELGVEAHLVGKWVFYI